MILLTSFFLNLLLLYLYGVEVSKFYFLSKTVGRTSWMRDRSVARPLPNTNRINTNTNKHPCLEWDSNPRSQKIVHALDCTATVIVDFTDNAGK
jgi:hypothetical protein